MSTPPLDPHPMPAELIDPRQQAHYWRALHGRAIAREQYWEGAPQLLSFE